MVLCEERMQAKDYWIEKLKRQVFDGPWLEQTKPTMEWYLNLNLDGRSRLKERELTSVGGNDVSACGTHFLVHFFEFIEAHLHHYLTSARICPRQSPLAAKPKFQH